MDFHDAVSSPPLAIKPDFDAATAADDSTSNSDYVDALSASEEEGDEDERVLIATNEGPGRRRNVASPAKRLAEEQPPGEQRPSKRLGPAFNPAYMNLLNADIEDAANHLLLEVKQDGKPHLFASKIGLTDWSSLEKELFFEAVSRLGRDDLPGIAKRVHTKSELEVRQFLMCFENVLADRERNPQRTRWEDVLEMADHPAATELSQPCCDALEEAADDLAHRTERYEQKLEMKKWGEGLWLVDRDMAHQLTFHHVSQEDPLSFAALFRLNDWLELSEEIFMNSSDPEANWRSIDAQGPSLRATALEDFHALVVSLTRKLVASTLFVAQSRIKSKRLVKPDINLLVKSQDVRAAAESLGLVSDRQRRWAMCARRCRLEVYEDPPEEDEDEDADQETPKKEGQLAEPDTGSEQQVLDTPFSYDEVEQMLLPQMEGTAVRNEGPKSRIMHLIDFELSEPDPSTSDAEPDSGDSDADYHLREETLTGETQEGLAGDKNQLTEEDIEVHEEAKEVLMYSARDFPETLRAQEALHARILREREQERYADYLDLRASREDEADLMSMLQRPSTAALAKVEEVERPHKSVQGLEEMHDSGTRWRDNIDFVSEWEHESKGVSL